MAPLHNPRHEAFVRGLFEGKSADESYQAAGYRKNDGNCIRLKGNERLQTRLAELQAEAQRRSEVTIGSLLSELEHARLRADSLNQLSASVKAISEKAKISGLLTQKIEIGSPGSFGNESPEELADAFLAEQILYFRPVDYRDREAFVAMLYGWGEQLREFQAAIKARPHTYQRIDQTDLCRHRGSN